jgi:hypothetical protein
MKGKSAVKFSNLLDKTKPRITSGFLFSFKLKL